MADIPFMLKLVALALLAGFLLYRQWQRERQRAALRRQLRPASDGLNVAPLRPRLNALRQNFISAAHEHARGVHARECLVAAARRKLSHLPFFRDYPVTHEGEHHAA
jgi:hypothetical protein